MQHGEMKHMWLNEFKIALVEKNIKKIDSLIIAMPQFKTISEMEEAFYLFKNAEKLLKTAQNETRITMKKLKNSIAFIKVSDVKKVSNIDIVQ